MYKFDDLLPGCLDGVTIVDFTWVLAGPWATKLLVDMGATVIKIEPYKVGANERHLQLIKVANDVRHSSYSINVNRGKKSISVNMKDPKGMEIITDCIKNADVLIENYSPGVMDRLGLDYEAVKKFNEEIIYCSISCFGHWGPYADRPGYDVVAQAASGFTAMYELPQGAPMSIGDTVAGTHAALAIVAALLHKQKSGRGQNIDISMMDCLFSFHENSIPWYTISQAAGQNIDPPRLGRYYFNYAPFGVFEGKDGRINLACLEETRWPSMLRVMGEQYAWLKDDPRAKDVPTRCMNASWLNRVVDEWVMSMDSVVEVERLLQEAGVACQRVLTIPELIDKDPHIKAREMIVEVEQPFLGTMKMLGSPIKMSVTPSCLRGYGPLLGEHNNAVLASVLGYSDEQIKALYNEAVLYHEPAVERL